MPELARDAVDVALRLPPAANADAYVVPQELVGVDVVILAVQRQDVFEASAELLGAVELADEQLVLAQG